MEVIQSENIAWWLSTTGVQGQALYGRKVMEPGKFTSDEMGENETENER